MQCFCSLYKTLIDIILEQVLGAAINVYANRHRERPTGLIDKLSSNHRYVYISLHIYVYAL
jgi:zinc finger FYVE domain-containing protein 26